MSAKKCAVQSRMIDQCSGGVAAFLIRLQQPESLSLPADDIQACFDALVADVNRRADDQLAQVMLAVTAEGAAEQLRRGRFHYADGDKRGQIVSSLRRLELGGQDIPIVVAKRLRD